MSSTKNFSLKTQPPFRQKALPWFQRNEHWHQKRPILFVSPPWARVSCAPYSPVSESSLRARDRGWGRASDGPEPGWDGHSLASLHYSALVSLSRWHGQQVPRVTRAMADEDTDWSYSETIPKPQISTLSKDIFSCIYLLTWVVRRCADCKLLYWELLRTNTSDYYMQSFANEFVAQKGSVFQTSKINKYEFCSNFFCSRLHSIWLKITECTVPAHVSMPGSTC